jgi:cation diffusion facilitator CzcD-associated flavoprotein CzcO
LVRRLVQAGARRQSGYTNASWTLKADIASEFMCRLINHMEAKGYSKVVAHASDEDRGDVSVFRRAPRSD